MRGFRSWGPRLTAAAAAFALTPVLWASSAQAELAQGEPDATVEFTGGCASELSGPVDIATPEPRRATIGEDAAVRLVNRLGERATLTLDGEAAAELPPGGAVELVLHSGPVEASLRITCGDREVAGTATIEVTDDVPAGEADEPSSPADDPDGSPGGEESAPATSGSALPSATGTDQPAAEDGADLEPVPASAGGGPEDGPNAVLALISAALVAGVLAAAIRSAAARRSARAEWT